MITIRTWNDLAALGDNERQREAFIFDAISWHKSTPLYQTAVTAEAYYNCLNPTIMHYQKLLYDMRGYAHTDYWAANHKIASNFFNFAITQEVQYLLGNGASFAKEDTKSKLGGTMSEKHGKRYAFDSQLQEAAKRACVDGVSFGFWNLDHLDVFAVTEFVPLYDEENGALKAGVRFWQLDEEKPLRATLYEIDGYTDYVKINGVIRKIDVKKPYIVKLRQTEADGIEIYAGDNYADFPIVPLWGNDRKVSELVGKQGTLDAFDLLNSNLVNNVDEGNYVYWAITNCGGMTDEDDQRFLEKMKTMHVAHVDDDGSGGANVQAHTIETPIVATTEAIATIKARLYEDFMALNTSDISASAKTATEIRAAYQALDSKCDALEYCIVDFVQKILSLAGINDTVSFKRSQIINKQEDVQTLLSAAQYLDDDTITEQICYLLGFGDKSTEIIKKRRAEEVERYRLAATQPDEEDDNDNNA